MKTDRVTIVFTDLERSTELLERLGDEGFEELRREHFEILRAPLGTFGGAEVKNVGDGLMLVFAQSAQALRYCREVQRMAAEFSRRQGDRALRIRMGVHEGTPIRAEDDYFGTAVVVASRLCTRAAGGQILISRETVEADCGQLAELLEDVGPLRLKGLSDPVSAVALGGSSTASGVAARVLATERLGTARSWVVATASSRRRHCAAGRRTVGAWGSGCGAGGGLGR